MESVRLSIDLKKEEHLLLKLECAKRGMYPKHLLQNLALQWIEDIQDRESIEELRSIVDNAQWITLQQLKRRMGWDALYRRNQ